MLSNRKWRKNTVVLVLVSPLLSVGMAERVPFILKSPCGWVAVVTSLAHPTKKANFMEFKFGRFQVYFFEEIAKRARRFITI